MTTFEEWLHETDPELAKHLPKSSFEDYLRKTAPDMLAAYGAKMTPPAPPAPVKVTPEWCPAGYTVGADGSCVPATQSS